MDLRLVWPHAPLSCMAPLPAVLSLFERFRLYWWMGTALPVQLVMRVLLMSHDEVFWPSGHSLGRERRNKKIVTRGEFYFKKIVKSVSPWVLQTLNVRKCHLPCQQCPWGLAQIPISSKWSPPTLKILPNFSVVIDFPVCACWWVGEGNMDNG